MKVKKHRYFVSDGAFLIFSKSNGPFNIKTDQVVYVLEEKKSYIVDHVMESTDRYTVILKGIKK